MEACAKCNQWGVREPFIFTKVEPHRDTLIGLHAFDMIETGVHLKSLVFHSRAHGGDLSTCEIPDGLGVHLSYVRGLAFYGGRRRKNGAPWIAFGSVIAVAILAITVRRVSCVIAALLCAAVCHRSRVIGLSGGIGTGKSTVGATFQEEGAIVLDLDAIYHGLLDAPQSPLAAKVTHRFPECMCADGSGRVDRAALRARVMTDASARRAINDITHPAIGWALLAALVRQRWLRGATVVVEAPLLLQRGFGGALLRAVCSIIVVTSTDARTQLCRVAARDGASPTQAAAAAAAQPPLRAYEEAADIVLWNGSSVTPEAFRDECRDVYRATLQWL